MKKILAILLCISTMSVLFVGCAPTDAGNGTQTPKGVFEAGYAREDITPDPANSYNLAGYGYARPSGAVADNLYITCTAIKDENGQVFLLYHCDFLKIYTALNMAKTSISKETGVPVENIMISTTHNHSAPSLDDENDAVMEDYRKVVRKAMIKTAKDAVADLKPAKIYISEIVCKNFNWIRSIGVSSNFDEELDDILEMIKFTREGEKDIVMVNWQGHPKAGGGADLVVRSDVDILRKNVEAELNCDFTFFLGASGNVSNHPSTYPDYVTHYNELTKKVVEAAANFREVTDGAIKKVTTRVAIDFKNGSGSDEVPISVISIGNSIAFAIVPYEMFSSSAKDIKAYSQFDQTFIVTCADSAYGYLPTIATPDDEYEVGATFYAKGSAEELVEGYKSLLDQLQGSK